MELTSVDRGDPPIDRNWSSTTPKVAPEPTIDRKWSSFHPDDILAGDLQGEAFWKDWHKAGGNCDEYMKETLPNYGLVGALLLTITIPAVLEPPEFFMSTDYGENNRFYVDLYVCCLSDASLTRIGCISKCIYDGITFLHSHEYHNLPAIRECIFTVVAYWICVKIWLVVEYDDLCCYYQRNHIVRCMFLRDCDVLLTTSHLDKSRCHSCGWFKHSKRI